MIKIEGLVKRFGSFTAVNGVSFNIEDGKIYGLVGINGAGKSTLLRTVLGIYKADEGSVSFDGEDVWNNPKASSRVAFVPDELFLPKGLNMIAMAKKYKSIYPHFNSGLFAELTGAFGLDPRKKFGTFSKGMRRQASTVLALALETDYLFFDETFDGLDPFKRAYIKRLIKTETERRGCSVVITSHSLRELEDICDRLAILDQGGLVFESDARDLVTTGLKVQIAFADDYDADRFSDFDVVDFVKHGSVANIVMRGDSNDIEARLKEMSPLLLETLPLSLEEVFAFELGDRGLSALLNGVAESDGKETKKGEGSSL